MNTRKSFGHYYVETICKYNTPKLARLARRAPSGSPQRHLAVLGLVARLGFDTAAVLTMRHPVRIQNTVRKAARWLCSRVESNRVAA